MKETNDLWEVIHSLSKQEKRHLQMQFKEDSLMARLFNFIGRQDEFNQEDIYRKFKPETPRHISSMQQYLFRNILKYLRTFHAASSVDIILNECLTEVEIFFNKGLLHQALKSLSKGKKIAYNNERYEHLDRFITFEEKVYVILPDFRKTEKYVKQYKEECKIVRDRLNEIGSTRELYHKVIVMTRKQGFSRSSEDYAKLNKIIEHHPLLKDPESLGSLRAKTNYYYTKIFYYHFLGDFKECYRYCKEYHDIVKQYSKKLLPFEYARHITPAMTNMAINLMNLKRYSEAEKVLGELRSFHTGNDFIESGKLSILNNLELSIYVATAQFEKIDTIVSRIDKEPDTKSLIDTPSLMEMYFNVSVMYFGTKRYKEALFWINKLLNDISPDRREDIVCFAQILRLIIVFETGDYDYLESLLRNTDRYLAKHNRLFAFEGMILKFIRRQLSLITPSESTNEFKKFYNEVKELFKDPNERSALLYFDFVAWIESKISNHSFAEIIKQHL